MAKLLPSPFRTALQVSPERIGGLDDADLTNLVSDLLRAQAHRCHSPPSEVRINAEDKAKDEGCDGWTAKPKKQDAWLGETDTCWQLKAGTASEPARLRGEILKPIPRTTLEGGGRFVLVASGSKSGIRGEKDRLETLQAEASGAGIPTESIEVIDADRLTAWCNQNPSVAAKWAGRPDGLWPLSRWASAQEHQVPWQATPVTTGQFAQQRSALEFESGSVQHLHIHGPPGVGKTRFALELCREAPWSGFVVYVRQASDLRLLELIDGAATDADVRLVVVADEVQLEHLRPLRESVETAEGRIRLVTVGHCTTPEPARIPALLIEPMRRETLTNVVKGWHPSMPLEHIDFIAQFADGYIRLARLAADAVARDTSLNVRGLLGRNEIRAFLDQMLGPGSRRALYVVAVLSRIGWTGDMQVEGEAAARHLGLDWNDVRHDVEEFHRRFAIVPRGGRYCYISPTPLGLYLAGEAWTTYPELLRSLPEALPTEDAKRAFHERLRSMASHPQAREYARAELRSFVRLDDFVKPRSVRRWSALSSADPREAAAKLLGALEHTSLEERSMIAGEARRETVRTLVRLAWHSVSFFAATKALALLAEAENESWSNNASGEFVTRFQITMGGTAVPYLERLTLVDELIEMKRAPLARLAVKALSRVGDRHSFRTVDVPASDELPQEEWRPDSWEENLRCVLAALERLAALATRGMTEIQGDFVAATQRMITSACDPRDERLVDFLCRPARVFEPHEPTIADRIDALSTANRALTEAVEVRAELNVVAEATLLLKDWALSPDPAALEPWAISAVRVLRRDRVPRKNVAEGAVEWVSDQLRARTVELGRSWQALQDAGLGYPLDPDASLVHPAEGSALVAAWSYALLRAVVTRVGLPADMTVAVE